MHSSVITFPGSNCDRDMDVALKKFGFKNKMVWHDDVELPKSDIVVLPGGFSYGDYLRCGSMASKSKIMKSVLNFAQGGKTTKSLFGSSTSLCQTILFLKPNFFNATSISLSQLDPGKVITDECIIYYCDKIILKSSITKFAKSFLHMSSTFASAFVLSFSFVSISKYFPCLTSLIPSNPILSKVW